MLQVTCIWEYDKRSVNGANFVYYGMFLRGVTGAREKALVAYAQQVRNVPFHSKNVLRIIYFEKLFNNYFYFLITNPNNIKK